MPFFRNSKYQNISYKSLSFFFGIFTTGIIKIWHENTPKKSRRTLWDSILINDYIKNFYGSIHGTYENFQIICDFLKDFVKDFEPRFSIFEFHRNFDIFYVLWVLEALSSQKNAFSNFKWLEIVLISGPQIYRWSQKNVPLKWKSLRLQVADKAWKTI